MGDYINDALALGNTMMSNNSEHNSQVKNHNILVTHNISQARQQFEKDKTSQEEIGGAIGGTGAVGGIATTARQVSAMRNFKPSGLQMMRGETTTGAMGYLKSTPDIASARLATGKRTLALATGIADPTAEEMASGAGKSGFLASAIGKGLTSAGEDATRAGAIGDVVGRSLGIGTGLLDAGEDIASHSLGGSEGKDADVNSKIGNVASMVAGGLDAISLVAPVIAPLAALVSVGATIESTIGGVRTDEEKAKDVTGKSLGDPKEFSTPTASIGGAGKIPSMGTSTTAY